MSNMSEQEKLLRHLLIEITEQRCLSDIVISIKPIENDGNNYTSALFTATISAANEETLNLFAKVATIGNKMREDSARQIFQIETFFYTKLLQMFRKLEDEYDIPESDRLKVSKFYGSHDEYLREVIVLENMTVRGFQVPDRIKPMCGEFALQSVKQLARFHALSLAFACHYPEEFEDIKQVLINSKNDSFKKFLSGIAPRVIESTEDDKKHVVTKLIESVVNRDDLNTVIVSTKRPMFIHADYRGGNLLYKNNNGKLEIIILDFQTITLGTPVFDLLYLLINGADKDFLDKWYYKLLDEYYSEFESALTRYKIDPATTFSREDFDQELKRMFPINLVLGLCCLLIVTVDADKAPKADETLDLSTFGLVAPNEVYKVRLNGIVEFFIQEGVLE